MSAAIPIVAPSPGSEQLAETPARPTKKDQAQRRTQCRNELIYGSCKFADSGCPFYHPSKEASVSFTTPPVTTSQPATPAPREMPSTPNTNTPSKGTSGLGGLSANVNAPIFVPKGFTPMLAGQANTPSSSTAPSTAPAETPTTQPTEYDYGDDFHFDYLDDTPYNKPNEITALAPPFVPNSQQTAEGYTPAIDPYAHEMNPYYAEEPVYPRQPLQYDLYNPPLPYMTNIPQQANPFLADDVREMLQRRSEAIMETSPVDYKLPDELHVYHSLVPIEPPGETRHPRVFQWPSISYKAISAKDGRPYILRRFEGFRLMHEAAFAAISVWNQIKHPGLVTLHEAFTTRAFGDSSLVFVFDYHPNSESLYMAHIKPKQPQQKAGRSQPHAPHLAEATMWSYAVQLADAMRVAHSHNLALRTLELTKVLLTGKNRVRVNCCGVFDVLNFNPAHNVIGFQQNDYMNFGKLLLELACNSTAAATNLPKSMDMVSKRYSPDLTKLILYLITPAGPPKNLDKLFEYIGSRRVLDELNAVSNYADSLEGQLMSELENARLVRLMTKLGFINERPEFDHDPRWSETGDRYIIKLFRDYVFHQVDIHGNPVVNLSHVLACLNKLDAGIDERVMLVSRDEQSCLVVSYKDIKSAIETAFTDLSRASVR
ncbi:hypothetical protein CALCODRAFT_504129 [Calocera cornea HHB12733]|uniref:PAN2-PAN3 deadenylation complex subunit PAN3 n=1 Tax=Calocera cornea HHB12733 TaxID=1353952 RepID=A0A165CKA5_9BASI|nr:hypothetical protein CALCODRAFT_504129 [Calocera cornea HHB12733]